MRASHRSHFPIFITCRDRLTSLVNLVRWLEKAGCQRIVLIDNNSLYSPLLEYLAHSPHTVIRYKKNFGHRVAWRCGIIKKIATDVPYVVTDPDVLPGPTCPLTLLDKLYNILRDYPHLIKAGPALAINDLPSHYVHRQSVIDWETKFWKKQIAPTLYDAPIDTTFALYRAKSTFAFAPSARLSGRYTFKHQPWYTNSSRLSEEDLFYRARARKDITSWDRESLPKWLITLLEKEKKKKA
jgi:hypothetical protein